MTHGQILSNEIEDEQWNGSSVSTTTAGTSRNALEDDNKMTLDCGTRQYMAPELYLLGAGFYGADIWALGITIYELLVGKRPWKVYEQDKMCTAYVKEYPEDFDESAKDFIQRCIEIDPGKRIGCGENEDLETAIFEHEFFKDKIDISNIHELTPPVDREIVEKIIKRNKGLVQDGNKPEEQDGNRPEEQDYNKPEEQLVDDTDAEGKSGIVESININQTKITLTLLIITSVI